MKSQVEYWDDDGYGGPGIKGNNESFWTCDAMKRAVNKYWFSYHRLQNTDADPMPNLTLTLDRERGVVVCSDET